MARREIHDLGVALRQYEPLLRDFVCGRMSADDFETKFNRIYLADNEPVSGSVFGALDGFFADVDAYVGEPDLYDEADGDLTADQLRDRARALLREGGYEI